MGEWRYRWIIFNLEDMMFDQIHVPAALLSMEIPVSTEYKAKWVSDQDLKFWRKELSCPRRESNHDYSDVLS